MKDYRVSHLEERKSRQYEEVIYKKSSYDDFLWRYEKNILSRIVEVLPPSDRNSYLDFACGTGRIIAHLEDYFKKSFGIDISSVMIEKAQLKTTHSEFFVKDITMEDIGKDRFDLITAFRFFLNAQPDLRVEAFTKLVPLLRNEDSRFIFNIHGNSTSHRFITKIIYALRGRRLNTISYWGAKNLARNAGLVVIAVYGFGIIPKLFYRFLPKVWFSMDRFFALFPFLRYFSYDLILVCKAEDTNSKRKWNPRAQQKEIF